MKINRIIPMFFIAVSILFMANSVFAGLGVSPSQIIVPNLSKGAHLERTFILSRSDPKENLYFTATMEGATKDWTVLDKGTEFTMPAGEKRFPITIIVNVPKDAANGEYKGGVRLVSSSNSDGIDGNGASTALASLIQTDFIITGEQILEYEISSIGIQNIEEGSPLDILLTVNNTGNVMARPTKVHVEVLDKFNTKSLESQDIIEMGSVAPFATGDIVIPAQTKLGIDQYWTRVSVYKNENLLKEESLAFEIVALGSLKKSGNLKELQYNQKAKIGETIKIIGIFENTGQSKYSAKLVTEISKNNKLVKMIESDLAVVNMSQAEKLSVYFIPEENGIYTVKAHVAYSGGKTEEKEGKIFVDNAGLFSNGIVIAVISLIIIAIIIITVTCLKKKRKKIIE